MLLKEIQWGSHVPSVALGAHVGVVGEVCD